MSDTMIMDALKAFLKPIIAEAMHEAGNIADTATPSDPITEQTASVQDSEEDLLPEETSKVPTPEEVRQQMLSKYYTVDDVKAILHIGTTSVYNLFKRNKLTKLKVLGKTVVAREELDNAVEAQEIYRYSHKR